MKPAAAEPAAASPHWRPLEAQSWRSRDAAVRAASPTRSRSVATLRATRGHGQRTRTGSAVLAPSCRGGRGLRRRDRGPDFDDRGRIRHVASVPGHRVVRRRLAGKSPRHSYCSQRIAAGSQRHAHRLRMVIAVGPIRQPHVVGDAFYVQLRGRCRRHAQVDRRRLRGECNDPSHVRACARERWRRCSLLPASGRRLVGRTAALSLAGN
jgi:hypothetical protein